MKERLAGIVFWKKSEWDWIKKERLPGLVLSLLFFLCAALLILISGCSTRLVKHTSPDGVMTEYREKQMFSKTALVGTVLGRETKTTKQLFGQKSSESETQTESIEAMFNGMQGLFEAGFKAGVKTVIPVP